MIFECRIHMRVREDINPIENLFHFIQSKLDRYALDRNITKETFERFSERVRETMVNYQWTQSIKSSILWMEE